MRFFAWLGQGRTLLLAAAVVVGAVCVSYGAGNNPSELVGRWEHYEGPYISIDDALRNIELFSDGTGVVETKLFGKRSATWKAENNRLRLLLPEHAIVADYKVSGYELILVYDEGKSATFVKKGYVEEYKKKKAEETNKKIKEEKQRLEKMSGYFTDPRDSAEYRTVKIGGKTWMAENLYYVGDKDTAWCYNGKDVLCDAFGALYTWNTAKTICPKGWHLPSREEWDRLAESVGGTKAEDFTEDAHKWDGAGKKLKSISIFYWKDGGGGGTDTYGFSALPGGYLGLGIGFDEALWTGTWWTATERDKSKAYVKVMRSYRDGVGEWKHDKGGGSYVRCVANN